MVKGKKRAIPIEKIVEKNSRATCFSKRRDGLFSKAADLCLLSDSQIAILATSSSSQSDASVFSFGHSSADAVVAAFLAGKHPVPVPFDKEDVGICLRRKDLGLGFWWDDERLAKSEDPEELRSAMDSVSRILQNLKELRSGEEAVDNQFDHCQTNFVDDDDECLKEKSDKNQELGQTLDSKLTCVISGNHNQDFVNDDEKKKSEVFLHRGTLDQTLNPQSSCAISDDYLETDTKISENLSNKALYRDSSSIQEIDLNQHIDFETLVFDDEISENTVMNSEAIADNDN